MQQKEQQQQNSSSSSSSSSSWTLRLVNRQGGTRCDMHVEDPQRTTLADVVTRACHEWRLPNDGSSSVSLWVGFPPREIVKKDTRASSSFQDTFVGDVLQNKDQVQIQFTTNSTAKQGSTFIATPRSLQNWPLLPYATITMALSICFPVWIGIVSARTRLTILGTLWIQVEDDENIPDEEAVPAWAYHRTTGLQLWVVEPMYQLISNLIHNDVGHLMDNVPLLLVAGSWLELETGRPALIVQSVLETTLFTVLVRSWAGYDTPYWTMVTDMDTHAFEATVRMSCGFSMALVYLLTLLLGYTQYTAIRVLVLAALAKLLYVDFQDSFDKNGDPNWGHLMGITTALCHLLFAMVWSNTNSPGVAREPSPAKYVSTKELQMILLLCPGTWNVDQRRIIFIALASPIDAWQHFSVSFFCMPWVTCARMSCLLFGRSFCARQLT